MIEIILRPARAAGRFDVLLDGEVLVAASRDPEHDAARALVARDAAGRMTTRWAGSSHLATKPRDIEATARWSITDNRRGIVRSRWAPFPMRGPRQEARSGLRQGEYRPHPFRPASAEAAP